MCGHDACTRKHKLAHTCRVSETMKDKFFALKTKVWNESHIVWEPFQTPIFTIDSHTWYLFKKHTEILRENIDSLEIVNQRGNFSQNIFKSIFFWLGHFMALIFEFKITNHYLLILSRIDWREWSKIKLEELLFWGISSKLFLLFSLD